MLRVLPRVIGAVSVLALGACEAPEDVGEVEVALTAVGDDGAIYRLPERTFLVLEGGPQFSDRILLDGDAPALALELPIGNYSWHLVRVGATDEEWPLERHDPSGEVEIVMARLLNVQPDELQITPDVRTSLVIAFDAARGGNITFATGLADVSVDVGATDALGGVIDWFSSTTTVTLSGLIPPPELASISLPTTGQSGFPVRLDARVAGPWEPSSTRSVCAPLQVDDIRGGGSEAFSDLLAESAAGRAEVCVHDNGRLFIELSRDGIGTSPTFEPLSTVPQRFTSVLTGTLPQPAFDGKTLDLSTLAGIYEALPGFSFYAIYDLSDPSAPRRWYHSNHSSEVHDFVFAPAQL